MIRQMVMRFARGIVILLAIPAGIIIAARIVWDLGTGNYRTAIYQILLWLMWFVIISVAFFVIGFVQAVWHDPDIRALIRDTWRRWRHW